VERGDSAGSTTRGRARLRPGGRSLPSRVAYLGITNGHDFIENDFFVFMYCVASVSFASFPLLAWRRNGSWHADPGFGRTTWFPWLFMTGQGVAYSAQRGDSNIFLLIEGWAGFMGAGVVAMYYLGNAFWLNEQDRAARESSKATVSEGVGRPDPLEPEADA
jgi:hypothetical protein